MNLKEYQYASSRALRSSGTKKNLQMLFIIVTHFAVVALALCHMSVLVILILAQRSVATSRLFISCLVFLMLIK